MTKSYPMALRERAVRFVEAGESRHAVARCLGVSVSCVVKWLARHSETASVKPLKIGGHVPRKIAGADREWLLQRIKGRDVMLQGLTDEFLAERGLKTDYRTMWNFVHREGLSLKNVWFAPSLQGL